MKKSYGFSLIELMIVVSIIGIISSIAYPSYVNSIKRSQRADAQTALTAFANAMEIWKMQHGNSYAGSGTPSDTNGAPLPEVFSDHVPISGGKKTYDLTLTVTPAAAPAPESFVLQAIPVDPTESTISLRSDGTFF